MGSGRQGVGEVRATPSGAETSPRDAAPPPVSVPMRDRRAASVHRPVQVCVRASAPVSSHGSSNGTPNVSRPDSSAQSSSGTPRESSASRASQSSARGEGSAPQQEASPKSLTSGAGGPPVMSEPSNHFVTGSTAAPTAAEMAAAGTTGPRARMTRPDPESAAAFAVQFRAAFRTLWTIAAGIVNDPAIAEDVVQEAALTALGKLSEFEPNTNFTAWMAKIVRFIALNQSRRGRRQPASLDPSAMDDTLTSRSVASGATSAEAGEGAAGAGGGDRPRRLHPGPSPLGHRLVRAP